MKFSIYLNRRVFVMLCFLSSTNLFLSFNLLWLFVFVYLFVSLTMPSYVAQSEMTEEHHNFSYFLQLFSFCFPAFCITNCIWRNNFVRKILYISMWAASREKKKKSSLDYARPLSKATVFGWSFPLANCITKTRLYNFDPLKPHFYIV